ncbi:metallophosphatase [Pseudoalteromonas rubra]|uniref:Metallophosphatase n=1 Tax=Pseudoalteromonas rubra TaxID=43658 RepID=A0A4Q7EKM6_9GAMM|nr:alkaline phosphatase D family protein [Pseudoalteromonas rubra]RZM84056.1 metallophosphatase [Pseudoalteromonas rubra]
MPANSAHLPYVLLGPMVRRAEPTQFCLQFVTTAAPDFEIEVEGTEVESQLSKIRLGTYLYLCFVLVTPKTGRFACDVNLSYRVKANGQWLDLSELSYTEAPQLMIPNTLRSVLHGSCRNPHHHSRDSLASADDYLSDTLHDSAKRPALLIMSGDQIYADDVAGPMLMAAHSLIAQLEIYPEDNVALSLPDSLQQQLYQRHHWLPKTPWQERSKWTLGHWLKKDEIHFSSVKAGNHLVTLEEFIACYVLNFSSQAWQLVDLPQLHGQSLNHAQSLEFSADKRALEGFIDTLPAAQRLFANVSTLMMFDDHDVTDDWNLTARWEQNIANSPASRRIIANGLISYWLFQGMGNDALAATGKLLDGFTQSLTAHNKWALTSFDKALHRFTQWHYCLETQPKVVVLDTRTHRWRNEQDFNEPSGLMDWETLMELQEQMLDQDSVLLVSPAPVFGVKAIETIQAVFNACGHPLVVDVENWMAHEGAAKKLIDIFKREDTPSETIILSGDVHYSFCFSVAARFGRHDNRIWQLTSSGIKNEFPKRLLHVLEKLDTWLFAPWSPFNLFTKRWQLSVRKHHSDSPKKRYLVSASAISLVELEQGRLSRYRLLRGDGEVTEFALTEHDDMAC